MIDVKFTAPISSMVLPVFLMIALGGGIRRVNFVVQHFSKKISYLACFAVNFLPSFPTWPILCFDRRGRKHILTAFSCLFKLLLMAGMGWVLLEWLDVKGLVR
jgi:hypothetical protein